MYRNIETKIWSDPKFKKLPPAAKLLFFYLITNDHAHLSGIYVLAKVIISYETGLSMKELDRVLDTLSGGYLAFYDPETEVVFVKNMFRYQGRGEKNERSAAKQLTSLHETSLIRLFLDTYPNVEEYTADDLRDRVSDRVSDKEQEQDKEQYQKKDKEQGARKKRTALPTDWKLPDDYREYCQQRRPDLDPAATAENFHDYYLSHGKPMADWKRTWQRWVRNENATGQRSNGTGSKPVSTPQSRGREAAERYFAEDNGETVAAVT